MEREQSLKFMHDLLRALLARKGSDLFITAGFPPAIKVDGEIVGVIGVSGAPTVQNDVDCARAALALVPDAVPTEQ